jgi:hypothetical protein
MILIKKNLGKIKAVLALCIALSSCEKVTLEKVKVEGNVAFTQDILPIFSNNCIACHGGSQKPDLRSDKAYLSLTNGGYYDLITPTDSKIYKKLILGSHETRATDVEKQKILLWIQQGAKND